MSGDRYKPIVKFDPSNSNMEFRSLSPVEQAEHYVRHSKSPKALVTDIFEVFPRAFTPRQQLHLIRRTAEHTIAERTERIDKLKAQEYGEEHWSIRSYREEIERMEPIVAQNRVPRGPYNPMK